MMWVRWAAKGLAPSPEVLEGVQVVDIDERHHFLLKKAKSFGWGKCEIEELLRALYS